MKSLSRIFSTESHLLVKLLKGRLIMKISFVLFFSYAFFCKAVYSQGVTVGARSYLVMNGTSSLVVKDAAFINNGTFSEAKSTVKFSGQMDTSVCYISGGATTFYNLSTNKSAFGIALKSQSRIRNVLNISGGQLYTDSNLILLSDASLTARVDIVPTGSTIVGKANVQRFIPGRRSWRLLTAPVTNSNTFFNSWQNGGVYEAGKGMYITGPNPTAASGNGLDASPLNNVSVRGFNYVTQAFTNLTNTKIPISTGHNGSADNTGYFVFVRGDRVYSNFDYPSGACNVTTLTSIGSLQTGTQIFNVSADSAKYTLIGNPYASPIDLNNVVRHNIVKRFFLFDPSIGLTGGWVMIDDIDGDGDFTKSVGASIVTKDIQSSQAFFVQTNGYVGSASITINENSKSGVNNTYAFRPNGSSAIESIRSNLFIPDGNGNRMLADGVLTEFKDGYSEGVNLEDASKIANTNENIGLVRKGLVFTVERRPIIKNEDTLYLRIWKTSQRNYQFQFEAKDLDHPGLQGMLEDTYLKTFTPINLNDTTVVDFNIDANAGSANQDRFRIVFKTAEVVLPVTVTIINAYLQNTGINIEWKVENEINIAKYEVERSIDGVSFSEINTQIVSGANNVSNNYNWLDKNPSNGNNFYRIKVIDATGQIKYSSIVKVFIGSTAKGINIYPNPVKGNMIKLQFTNQEVGDYSIRLINNVGQVLYQNTIKLSEGNSNQSIKITSSLPEGTYQLEIIDPFKNKNTQKLFVE